MSKVNVFDQGWIDLVFEGRNQNYGAYQLRKENPKTTMIALFSGIGLMVVLVGIPALLSHLQPIPLPDVMGTEITPTIIDIEPYVIPEVPKAKTEPVIEEPAAPAAQSNVATIEFKPLVATSDPTPVAPNTTDFNNAVPGATNTTGTGNTISLNPGTAPEGTGLNTKPTAGTGETIETIVDIAPVYPGGLDQFRKDVGKNFRTPEVNDATIMRVYVSFVVETDGTLSNIKTTRDPGFGMGTEAVRVLKSLKARWKPGMKAGKAVRTAYSLPITVKVN